MRLYLRDLIGQVKVLADITGLFLEAWLDEAPTSAVVNEKASSDPVAEEVSPKSVTTKKSKAKAEKKEEIVDTDPFEMNDLKNEPEADVDDFGDLEERKEEKVDVTPELLRKTLVDFARAKSKEEAYEVLGKFGAKKVQDLKPADHEKVYNALKKAM